MLETFLVTFREGVESFLIVAIIASYLLKTNKHYLINSLSLGVVFAILLSYLLGGFLSDFGEIAIFEGVLAIVSAFLVGSLTFYVHKNAWRFSGDIKSKIDKADSYSGVYKYFLTFIFSFFMVFREGIEVSLLLSVISYEAEANKMYIGAFFGFISAALLGFLWIKYNKVIDIAKFMKITTAFLLLFTLHLLLYGFHELTELSAVPFIDNDFWHMATEDFEGDGIYGKLITYGFIIFPFSFLFVSIIKSKSLARASC